jgi:hypothetical protein
LSTEPPTFDQERTNPFATRWTRPGAIPFDFGGESTIEELLHRFWRSDCRGEIVGAHGSGKSTLLATMVPALEAACRPVVVARMRGKRRRLTIPRRALSTLDRAAILVIDGYEQLTRWGRWRLLKSARRRAFGLIVTSHKPTGLPLLYRMSPNLELVKRLIGRYLPSHHDRIMTADIERAWRRHRGNVRELFFDLYDVFEARRSEGEL